MTRIKYSFVKRGIVSEGQCAKVRLHYERNKMTIFGLNAGDDVLFEHEFGTIKDAKCIQSFTCDKFAIKNS